MTSWKNSNYPVTTDLPEEQDLTTGINELNIQPLSISPIPVTANLILNNLPSSGSVKIFTALGQLVSSLFLMDNELFVGSLTKGVYLLQFIPDDESSVFVGRFLKL